VGVPMDGSGYRQNQTVKLADGRTLGFAEYGDPSGRPVFFFPGTPSGRLFHHPDESIAVSVAARVLTIDRPGYGLSDFQPGRTLLDWPSDVRALADTLGIDRFAVAGISGEAPYVAACALRVPGRLTAATIISGLGPIDWQGAMEGMPRERRVGVRLGRRAPWLVRPVLWLTVNPHRSPQRFYERMVAQSSEVDRALLARPEIKAMLIANWTEANRSGVRGYAWETVIFSRPWGFRLEDIAMEIHLWHGEEDASMPIAVGQYLAKTIPKCHSTFLPGEGHFLLFEHWAEILAAMAL
jgi:pimeloyl-ACP methyl ester carboxylesterase